MLSSSTTNSTITKSRIYLSGLAADPTNTHLHLQLRVSKTNPLSTRLDFLQQIFVLQFQLQQQTPTTANDRRKVSSNCERPIQRQWKVVYTKYVRITTNQPDTKSKANSNATIKRHSFNLIWSHALRMQRNSYETSSADCMGHGGGTVSRRTANKKLTKLHWPSRKRLPKRLIVLLEPKSGGARLKNFFPADRCLPHFRSGPVPPLSNSLRRHCRRPVVAAFLLLSLHFHMSPHLSLSPKQFL